MATLSIVDFLNARLKDDEDQALDRNHEPLRYGVDKVTDSTLSDRVLREVAAKRAIVNMHYKVTLEYPVCAECETARRYPCRTLKRLAAVYSDHPDYAEKWKP